MASNPSGGSCPSEAPVCIASDRSLTLRSRLAMGARWAPVFAALVCISCVAQVDGLEDEENAVVASANSRLLWHAGAFRYLPARHADLVDFVESLPHPNAGGYGMLSSQRKARFELFIATMFEAIAESQIDGRRGDWCRVMAMAGDAGYELYRLRDSRTGRWLIYGRDTTRHGQAYFFVNPYAKRNLVIEVPHSGEPFSGAEWQTPAQGARLLIELAGRVLIINKEHRCSDPDSCCDSSTRHCNGSGTHECGGRYRESDVSHHPRNTFHALHAWLSDNDPGTRFVQIHGMSGAANDMIEISDGTNTVNTQSVAVQFRNNLRRHVPNPSAVHACQASSTPPPSNLCGIANVQAQHTNNPNVTVCTAHARTSSGRFLHLEQAQTLRDDDSGDGWYWGDVAAALEDTWPQCPLANGASDCTVGAPQTDYASCTCGQVCW